VRGDFKADLNNSAPRTILEMKQLPSSRIFIAIGLVVLFLLFFVALLFISNLSFSVWAQLQQKPLWLQSLYISGVVLISLIFGRMIGRILWPKKKSFKEQEELAQRNRSIQSSQQRFTQLNQKIASQDNNAIDSNTTQVEVLDETPSYDEKNNSLEQWQSELAVSPELVSIKNELRDYSQRKSQKRIYIAVFGDISSGKSSVIKALINYNQPADSGRSHAQEYSIHSSVIGGTTREVTHYEWRLNNHIEQLLTLTDMPGLNEQFAHLDPLSIDEVQRAHIALYLCDGDLTASQFTQLKKVIALNKPCIIALNKSERYSKTDQQQLVEQLKKRLQTVSPEHDIPIVLISAGGFRDYIRVLPNGDEERVQRPIEINVQALYEQLLMMLSVYNIDQLEQFREASVATMINQKLDDVEGHFKRSQSQRLIKTYTQKAVVASMATISPGSDLLVQGYLGIQMVKDLCKLYHVNASDIDANKLLELIQSRMGKTLPLLLAIAGNGLKAFPGMGTISGGAMHAVAYGMIFDTLGRSVSRTLEVTGQLSPVLISDLYKEQLSETIESRTKDFIKLVFKLRNDTQ